jgi:hypothetical protein
MLVPPPVPYQLACKLLESGQLWLVWILESWDLLSYVQCNLKHRQAFLSRQCLVATFLDIKKACSTAGGIGYSEPSIMGNWSSIYQSFYSVLNLIDDFKCDAVHFCPFLEKRRMVSLRSWSSVLPSMPLPWIASLVGFVALYCAPWMSTTLWFATGASQSQA